MEITVKSTKMLKDGTNDYGAWKLIAIVTSEDIKYTTLAKGAETITAGAVIDISNMDEDDKGKSFKKFKIISEGRKPPSPSEGDGMTPDMWDEKDKKHRESIESQVAFKGVVELMVALIISKDDQLGKATLSWAKERLLPPTTAGALLPVSA